MNATTTVGLGRALFLSPLLFCLACPPQTKPITPTDYADPFTVLDSQQFETSRGLRVVRGIVHAHSPYSHDACDGEPRIDNAPNAACLADLRRGLCAAGRDFVFLTDHDDNFERGEFPAVLLYEDGDRLIERDGRAVANAMLCDDGHEVIIAAGTESGMMPIGLEGHVGASPAARHQAYNDISVAGVERLRQQGALVFLQHTEGWSVDEILDLGVDGIEVYNLHQNMMDNMGTAVTLALELSQYPERVPVPELAILAVFEESAADLERWARVVQQREIATVLATDVHQNVFNDETYDGERLDSFRRMMHWFANYLLVDENATLDDTLLKRAIAERRGYGVFEYLGYPVGFDFYAIVDGQTREQGALIETGGEVTLKLKQPEIYGLDPRRDAPVIYSRILRAEGGEWVELARNEGDIEQRVGPGVYRAEVRMIPNHLREWLGRDPEAYLRELVWIYSSPIYLR